RRMTANSDPPVNHISATAALLTLIDLRRFNGFLARLNHTRKVVWMNGADQGPVFQLFSRSTEIIEGLLVEKLYLAHCTRRGREPGNVVDDLPPGQFPRT